MIRSINKNKISQFSPWFILGLFAILSSCATAVGRSGGWALDQSLSSRYITASSLLIIADVVLCIGALNESKYLPAKEKILISLNSCLFTIVIIGLIISMIWGWKSGEFMHSWKASGISYLKHFEAAPDSGLKLFSPRPAVIREMAAFLRDKKLSVFRVWKEINLSNYKEMQLPKEVFFGNIDTLEIIPSKENNYLEDIIIIAGWAMDPVTKTLPKGIFILCDGELLGRAFLNEPRPDISKALKNDDLINSGWEFVIRKNKINPGLHKIAARVIFQSPGNYYRDMVKEVTIK